MHFHNFRPKIIFLSVVQQPRANLGGALEAEAPHPLKFYHEQARKLLEVIASAIEFYTHVWTVKANLIQKLIHI